MTLKETADKLIGILDGLEDQCQVIIGNIDKIENDVAFNGPFAINFKLQFLRFWIMLSEVELYIDHQYQGYVCVFLTEYYGVSVQWVEDKKLVENKAVYESKGQRVFSIEEISENILQFEKEVAEGTWVKAVTWLNIFGKSAGRDFRKLPVPASVQELQ